MHPFSLQEARFLVASKSQSDGPWRPCQSVPHSPPQIQVAPREELPSGHDAFEAKSQTSPNASQSTFREITATIGVSSAYSVVPERDRVGLPMEAYLEVHVATDLLEQKVEDGIRFGLGHADDATGEAWVDVDTLPAGHGVNPNDRVDRLDRFATNVEPGSAGTISLSHGTVEGGKALQVGLQPRAEGRVKGIPVLRGHALVSVARLVRRSLTYPELHSVSPPYSGPVMTFRDVVLGGWISYVTSLCQSSNFEKAVESGRRAASLYTTTVGVSAGVCHTHIRD